VDDPHHFDADPDSTDHPDADPDSNFLFDADPDPTFHPDQSAQIGSYSIHFGLTSAN
jgi:hypothetical protein